MKYDPTLELYPTKRNKHLFKKGEICELTGLETCPEYNGQTVKIMNYRQDGEYGKTYYVLGDINKELQWVYEYRLKKVQVSSPK